MRFGVLGTGMVGHALAGKLVELGHAVTMGSREAGNEKAVAWADSVGSLGHEGSFADAAEFGETVINATSGSVSLAALASAGTDNLANKVLIDVSNPLDFSAGMPPTLTVANTDSIAEQIQHAFPDTHVVKTLNTINAQVMVDPGRVSGKHNIFLSGNDSAAKHQVTGLLESFGWPVDSILDLGDISSARGPEMYLPLWLKLYGVLDTGDFNIGVQTAQ